MVDSKRKYLGEYRNTLHAINFLGECPDNQSPVILLPSFNIGNNIDLRLDIGGNIFLVSGLVFKRDVQRC